MGTGSYFTLIGREGTAQVSDSFRSRMTDMWPAKWRIMSMSNLFSRPVHLRLESHSEIRLITPSFFQSHLGKGAPLANKIRYG